MDAEAFAKAVAGLRFAAAARDPLVELVPVRQVPGEPRRRWFASADIDLIVWYGPDGAPVGFQLCYDKRESEHAITLWPSGGFVHMAVDDGETDSGNRHKGSPILVANGVVPVARIAGMVAAARDDLPEAVVAFVEDGIRRFAENGSARQPLGDVGPVEGE